MCTGIIGKYCINNFYLYIGYPIGDIYQLYEGNKSNTNILLADCITSEAYHIDVIIYAIYKHHVQNTFDVIDKDTHPKFSDCNSKSHGVKTICDLMNFTTGA